mgnify:CR=1 FL=1
MPEEILVIDPLQRRFQYRLDVPIFAYHRGTIDVIELGPDDCLVVYSTDAEPRTMALTIAGATAGALDELKRLMEADAATSGPAPRASSSLISWAPIRWATNRSLTP